MHSCGVSPLTFRYVQSVRVHPQCGLSLGHAYTGEGASQGGRAAGDTASVSYRRAGFDADSPSSQLVALGHYTRADEAAKALELRCVVVSGRFD
jgi:hypothetical protein